MAGPWEDYAVAAPATAAAAQTMPWEDFQASTPVTASDRAHALEGGVLGGLAYGATAIPDAVSNLWNLGKAGYGTAMGMLHSDDNAKPLTKGHYDPVTGKGVIEPTGAQHYDLPQVGAAFPVGQALTGAMDKTDLLNTQAPRPDDTASRYLNTAGNVIGGVATGGGGLKSAAKAVAAGTPGAVAGRAVAEAKPFESDAANNAASILTQALGTAAGGAALRGPGELLPENQIKNDAVTAGQKVGYQFPPATTNPTRGNIARETIAGKTNVAQHMAIGNQGVTNESGRSALNLPAGKGGSITDLELAQARTDASPGYDAIRQAGTINAPRDFAKQLTTALSKQSGAGRLAPGLQSDKLNQIVQQLAANKTFDSGDAIDAIQGLRDKSSAAYRAGEGQEGSSYKSVAKVIEDAMDQDLSKRGGVSAKLVQDFKNSRQQYAVLHTIEDSRNPTTGNLVATKLAAALKRGDYMSGQLKVAGQAAGQAPAAFAEPTKTAGNHLGLAGALMGGGALAEMIPESLKHTGLGGLALAASYPLARWGTRQYIQGPGQAKALPRTKPPIWSAEQLAASYPVAAADSTR